jgi:threonine dehydrogenase-like Zn-dependent dehydrogenase
MGVGLKFVNNLIMSFADLNQERLDYAAKMCPPEKAREKGVDLCYVNTSTMEDPVQHLLDISQGGFDDVFVMVPVPALFTQSEKIACEDGCINFLQALPSTICPAA